MSYIKNFKHVLNEHRFEIKKEIEDGDDFLFVLGSKGSEGFCSDQGNPAHLSKAIKNITKDDLLMMYRILLPIYDNLMDYLMKQIEKDTNEF